MGNSGDPLTWTGHRNPMRLTLCVQRAAGVMLLVLLAVIVFAGLGAAMHCVQTNYQRECAASGHCNHGVPTHIRAGCFCLEKPAP